MIARNGIPIVEMKLIKRAAGKKRIGVAEGKLTVPDDFDQWDAEVERMFAAFYSHVSDSASSAFF